MPLDAHFSSSGTSLYVTFHGSSDRTPPTGYKLSQVPFKKDGGWRPVADVRSREGYADVWSNVDVGKCTMLDCFRPVGVAVDAVGRLYVTSDSAAEGELFLVGEV